MQNELELPDEMVKDGLALARLMADETVWPALQRLLVKMNDDAIAHWLEGDESATKKWLKGYRQCLGDLQLRIQDRAKLAEDHMEAKKNTTDAARSLADEGMGAGELAIA